MKNGCDGWSCDQPQPLRGVEAHSLMMVPKRNTKKKHKWLRGIVRDGHVSVLSHRRFEVAHITSRGSPIWADSSFRDSIWFVRKESKASPGGPIRSMGRHSSLLSMHLGKLLPTPNAKSTRDLRGETIP